MDKIRHEELKVEISNLQEVDKLMTEKINELEEAKELTFDVVERVSKIKQYKASDLPAYFKWDKGFKTWYYRVRVVDGKIVADYLKDTSEGFEYHFSTITCAFDASNDPITEDVWRNQMHKFIKQLK